ncbi:stalk domain-containing protein [Paenibacillus tarimensis]
MINGTTVEIEDPILLVNNRLFVPIGQLAELTGGTVNWDQKTKEVMIVTAHGDQLAFAADDPGMKLNGEPYFMDVTPFIHSGRTYIPLRHAAEFLHAQVGWDQAAKRAAITDVPLYETNEGDSWDAISERFGTTEQLLKERNQMKSTDKLQAATLLKVIIPDIMDNKVEPVKASNNEDVMLLAKIVQVEAGYESYDSQLAVANVILNRVNDKRFPDTIRDVIYQPGQFPPAHNGLLNKSEPSANVIKAAEAAYGGENNVEGAIYFYNPKVTGGKFWDNLTLVKEIGNHRYVK